MAANQKSKPTIRSIASRENGSYGGGTRADNHDPAVLSEWSSRGGKAVLKKYGREYFVAIRKRRKNYPKFSEPPAKPNSRAISARENGQKGGERRAELYGPDWLSEWGRLGGIVTRTRYGNEFYRKIRAKRKSYKKGYQIQKTKKRWQKECESFASKERNVGIAELWRAAAKNFVT
jgi:hypothetical protein